MKFFRYLFLCLSLSSYSFAEQNLCLEHLTASEVRDAIKEIDWKTVGYNRKLGNVVDFTDLALLNYFPHLKSIYPMIRLMKYSANDPIYTDVTKSGREYEIEFKFVIDPEFENASGTFQIRLNDEEDFLEEQGLSREQINYDASFARMLKAVSENVSNFSLSPEHNDISNEELKVAQMLYEDLYEIQEKLKALVLKKSEEFAALTGMKEPTYDISEDDLSDGRTFNIYFEDEDLSDKTLNIQMAFLIFMSLDI